MNLRVQYQCKLYMSNHNALRHYVNHTFIH